jgi:hypothetical protein
MGRAEQWTRSRSRHRVRDLLVSRQHDGEHLAVLWVLPSIGIPGVVLFAMHLGWIAVLVGQIVHFIGITIYRVVVTDKDKA